MNLTEKITIVILSTLFSSAVVFGMYLVSEDQLHRRNDFIRRFPAHAQLESAKVDLQFNGYYFAGLDDGRIFLGNNSAPLNVSIIDTALKTRHKVRIQMDTLNFGFRSIAVKVIPPYFFVMDGTVPCVYRGKINDWKATLMTTKLPVFSLAEPIDSTHIVLRITDGIKSTNTLAVYDVTSNSINPLQYKLPKQVDGIFDSDGAMAYNDSLQRLYYSYNYRNQVPGFDKSLSLVSTNKTIDTVSKAQVKVKNWGKGESQLAAPALRINKAIAVNGHFLYVQSDRLGRFEKESMLSSSSTIDIYDLLDNSYLSSEYIYNIDDKPLRSFRVKGNRLYMIAGRYLAAVNLSPKLIKANNKK